MTFESKISKPDDIPITVTVTMTRYEWCLILRHTQQSSDFACEEFSESLRRAVTGLDQTIQFAMPTWQQPQVPAQEPTEPA